MTFGFETTTDIALEDADLAGKTVIVTGASGGLGEETARALAAKGASVTITARDLAKGEAAAEKIRQSTGNQNVDVYALELVDLDSVRTFADKWQSEKGPLNILINNAGIMACPLSRTASGWELQFATNHIGHFLLTCLLVPALRSGSPARIVNLSSAGHKLGGVDLEDPHFEQGEYDKWTAYGRSKTANILFSVELNQRLSGAGITANAVHPGGIMTELGRHLEESDMAVFLERAGRDPSDADAMKFKSIPQGAATSVWAATHPSLEGKGGLYLEDCQIGELAEGLTFNGGYQDYAVDPQIAAQLWTLSEGWVNQRFDNI